MGFRATLLQDGLILELWRKGVVSVDREGHGHIWEDEGGPSAVETATGKGCFVQSPGFRDTRGTEGEAVHLLVKRGEEVVISEDLTGWKYMGQWAFSYGPLHRRVGGTLDLPEEGEPLVRLEGIQ
jgi:hypothetical protein